MNKKSIIAIGVVIVLSIIVYIASVYSRGSIERQKQILENAQIILMNGEDEIVLDIDTLKSIEEEDFDAVLDTSSTDPTVHTYKGAELKNILSHYHIDIDDKKTAILTGVDGYAVAYSMDEVLQDENIYVAYMEDGKYLGSRDSGGRGPYEAIVVSDQFSNRRCKWLIKIEVK